MKAKESKEITPGVDWSFLGGTFANGIIFGIDSIIACLSFAAFIYSGPLADYFPLGFNLILIGASLVMIVTALFSSIPLAIAGAQDYSLPAFAMMAASIATMLGASHLHASILSTVIFTMCFATVTTGILFYVMAKLKWGNFICFMPYPVIGGFLAGTGWLLFHGAFGIVTPYITHFWELFEYHELLKWLPAFLYALILLWLTQNIRYVWQWPALVLAGFLLFYLCVFVFQIPISVLKEKGFLLEILRVDAPVNLLHSLSFTHISWPAFVAQLSSVGVIIILSAIGILFNATGLEVSIKQDVRFNRELRVAGIGNILSGLFGGMTGYINLSNTIINYKTQRPGVKNGRAIGLIAGLVCLTGLFIGLHALAFLPRFLVAGLLMYFGLYFLKQWAVDIRKTLPWTDSLLILFILLTIALFGLLPGILLGIILSIIHFVVNYSRINIVKFVVSGNNFHSHKQRDSLAQKKLSAYLNQILYFKLQNYLFFGNSDGLMQNLRKRLKNSTLIHYVIYDFSQVTGIDSSAMITFERIKQLAIKENIIILIASLDEKSLNSFIQNKILDNQVTNVLYFENYDLALEFCEEQILEKLNCLPTENIPLSKRLSEMTKDKEILQQAQKYFQKIRIEKGKPLFLRGDATRGLFYIESGEISIWSDLKYNIPRLRTVGAGNMIGEISLYLSQKRTATAIVNKDAVLEYLSLAQFNLMKQESPALSLVFDELIIQILAERVSYTNKQVAILHRS